MASDADTLTFAPATAVSTDRRRDVTAPRPLRPAMRGSDDLRMSFAGGVATLGGSILVALAVPLMVLALPVVLLVRLVLTIVWSRSR